MNFLKGPVKREGVRMLFAGTKRWASLGECWLCDYYDAPTVGGMRPANISAGVGRDGIWMKDWDVSLDISRLCSSGRSRLSGLKGHLREVRFEGGLRDLARGTMAGLGLHV